MAKEIFTPSDEALFKSLQAKKKRAQRQETEFWHEVATRIDEILARFGGSQMSDTCDSKWKDIVNAYGAVDEDDLYQFIIRDKAISVYREKHLGS